MRTVLVHSLSRSLIRIIEVHEFGSCEPLHIWSVLFLSRPAALAHSSNGGVVVTASPEASRHRDLIVTLTARQRLPPVYAYRSFSLAARANT